MDASARRRDLGRLIRAAEWKLRQAPHDPLLRLDLGKKYVAGGRFEEAIPHLEFSIRDPRAAAAGHYYLARCRMASRAYDLAIGHLEAARAATPHGLFLREIAYHLVRCLQEEGRHEDARRIRDEGRRDS